jgi:hypothetical protein
MLDLNSPRIRFNGGFHDGAADAPRGNFKPGGILTPNKPHFDKIYEQGYRAGYLAAHEGQNTDSSEPAWKVRCTCKVPFGSHSEGCKAKLKAVA